MCSSILVERSTVSLEQKRGRSMKKIDLLEVCREVKINNPALLITRENGQKIYSVLQKRIEAIKESESPIMVIFPKNQLMDVSFADEVVIRIGQEVRMSRYGPGQGLILKGLGEDSIKNLDAAIKLQNLKIAFLVIRTSGEWDCIGQLEKNLRDTLNLLYEKEHLTALELVKQLGLAINTASTRLKRLYDLHLIKRDFEITENGLQYIYHFWNLEKNHD